MNHGPATVSPPGSAPKVGDGEVEHLVAPSAHHGLDHVEGEALGHLESDRGRHGEFLPVDHGIDQHRPVMSEGSRDARLDIGGVLEPDAADADGLGHGGEIQGS